MRQLADLRRYGPLDIADPDNDRAIARYTAALEMNPDDAQVWYNRALAYVANHWYRIGIRDFTEAIERRPTRADYLYQRGRAWYAIKQYKLAISDYNIALLLIPTFDDALHDRGLAYRAMEQYDDAKSDFKFAVLLKPNSVQYQTSLQDLTAQLQVNPPTNTNLTDKTLSQQTTRSSRSQLPIITINDKIASSSSSNIVSDNKIVASISIIRSLLIKLKNRVNTDKSVELETIHVLLSLPHHLRQTFLRLFEKSNATDDSPLLSNEKRRLKRSHVHSESDDQQEPRLKKRVSFSINSNTDAML